MFTFTFFFCECCYYLALTKYFHFYVGQEESKENIWMDTFAGCWLCASNYVTMVLLFICRFHCLCVFVCIMPFAIRCHAVTAIAGAAADNDDDDDDDCGLLKIALDVSTAGGGKSMPCHSTICRNILLYYLSFNYYFCDAIIILKTNEALYVLLCVSDFFSSSVFFFFFLHHEQ